MAEVSSHYRGEEGAEYNEVYEDLYEAQAETVWRTIRGDLDPDARVLDFGCANGSLLSLIPNDEKVGVEVNPASRRLAAQRDLDVRESLDAIETGSIDSVVSSHVLEHTLNPFDELKGLRRVLRPLGTLMLVLPVDDWRTQRRWTLPETNHHLYTWTPQNLANLLDEAGFDVRRVDLWPYALPGRLTPWLWNRLPRTLFDVAARFTALTRRRRQLRALATSP